MCWMIFKIWQHIYMNYYWIIWLKGVSFYFWRADVSNKISVLQLHSTMGVIPKMFLHIDFLWDSGAPEEGPLDPSLNFMFHPDEHQNLCKDPSKIHSIFGSLLTHNNKHLLKWVSRGKLINLMCICSIWFGIPLKMTVTTWC